MPDKEKLHRFSGGPPPAELIRRLVAPGRVDQVDAGRRVITVSTVTATTGAQSSTPAGEKGLDAILAIVETMQPDPAALLERVQSYVDRRAQKDVESARASWVSDWLRRRHEWLERLGKLLTAAEVNTLSPSMKSSAAVHKARHEGRLIAIDLGDRAYFPAFQLDADGVPAAWVRDLAEALPDSDTLLQFLAAARPALKGRSYADLLRDGKATPPVLETMLRQAREIAVAEAR